MIFSVIESFREKTALFRRKEGRVMGKNGYDKVKRN